MNLRDGPDGPPDDARGVGQTTAGPAPRMGVAWRLAGDDGEDEGAEPPDVAGKPSVPVGVGAGAPWEPPPQVRLKARYIAYYGKGPPGTAAARDGAPEPTGDVPGPVPPTGTGNSPPAAGRMGDGTPREPPSRVGVGGLAMSDGARDPPPDTTVPREGHGSASPPSASADEFEYPDNAIVVDFDTRAYTAVEGAYMAGACLGGETEDAYAAGTHLSSATQSQIDAIFAAARQVARARAMRQEIIVLRNSGFFGRLCDGGLIDQDSEEDTYADLPDLIDPDDLSLASTEPESDSESESDSEWGLGGTSAQG